MVLKNNKIICQCNGVTKAEISLLLKKGAKNVDEISNFTRASTGCGRCKIEIQALLDQHLIAKKPDFQHKIEF